MLQRNQRNVTCCWKKTLRMARHWATSHRPSHWTNHCRAGVRRWHVPRFRPSAGKNLCRWRCWMRHGIPRKNPKWSSWWNPYPDLISTWSTLVGGDWNMNGLCFHIWGIILPTEELIFFKRGRYTTNQNMFQGLPVQAITHPASWQAEDWIVSAWLWELVIKCTCPKQTFPNDQWIFLYIESHWTCF